MRFIKLTRKSISRPPVDPEIVSAAKEGFNNGLHQLADASMFARIDEKTCIEYCRIIESFELSDDPCLKIKLARLLNRAGYHENAFEILEELSESDYLPAVYLVALQEFYDKSRDDRRNNSADLLGKSAEMGYLPSKRHILSDEYFNCNFGFRKFLLFYMVVLISARIYLFSDSFYCWVQGVRTVKHQFSNLPPLEGGYGR